MHESSFQGTSESERTDGRGPFAEESGGIRGTLLRGVARGSGLLLGPPRRALTVALGGSVLIGRLLQHTVNVAAAEGERQLTRLDAALGLSMRVWPWGGSID
jgi:hypothetical protein